jgi:ecotin
MQPLLINYNSKLPVVVYVPEGMDLKYRIWKAGKIN